MAVTLTQPTAAQRGEFEIATPTPKLFQLTGDTSNYYVKLTQAEGMKDPFAIRAKVEGEVKPSFFRLAGVRIVD